MVSKNLIAIYLEAPSLYILSYSVQLLIYLKLVRRKTGYFQVERGTF